MTQKHVQNRQNLYNQINITQKFLELYIKSTDTGTYLTNEETSIWALSVSLAMSHTWMTG